MENPSPFESGADAPTCPSCGKALETILACSACGALLGVTEDSGESEDPCPFAVFGMAPTHAVDTARLERSLLLIGKACHPDYFVNYGPDARALAERNTALLNRAYRILGDDAARADHLVRSLGGPDEASERQMPQAFLMEVLEWNETLEEARDSALDSQERRALAELRAELIERRREALESIARVLNPLPQAEADELIAVRRELNAVRYLDRALRELEELRLESANA